MPDPLFIEGYTQESDPFGCLRNVPHIPSVPIDWDDMIDQYLVALPNNTKVFISVEVVDE